MCNTLLIDDVEINEHDQIMIEQVRFYTELYKADEKIKFEIKNKNAIQINKVLHDSQNKEFNKKEIATAVLKMANNKTPGNDGLPIDIYKVFWAKISNYMFDMITESYEGCLLPENTRQGILNLIPKQNKDKRRLQNLRPITLLNADYKVIEKALSMRLKPALKEIIDHDQTGFMPDRKIATNIRKIYDLLYIAEERDLEAVILSCDFLKCFDRVEFSCIEGSLRYFHFAEYIINWVKILYSDFTVRIQNNGYLSEPIRILRSIHQGGCCSAEIFLICAEVLAILLRNEQKNRGYPSR